MYLPKAKGILVGRIYSYSVLQIGRNKLNFTSSITTYNIILYRRNQTVRKREQKCTSHLPTHDCTSAEREPKARLYRLKLEIYTQYTYNNNNNNVLCNNSNTRCLNR